MITSVIVAVGSVAITAFRRDGDVAPSRLSAVAQATPAARHVMTRARRTVPGLVSVAAVVTAIVRA